MSSILLGQLSLILAQGDGAAGGGGLLSFPVMMALLMLVFWMLIIRPDQKKRKAQQAELENLKANDRVVTIGGIYGIVTNVQRDADRVTIRVDESNNTKLNVTFGAIARIVTKDKESGE